MNEPDVSGLLTVQQAIGVIDAVAVSPRIVRVPLGEAAGLRLAERIVADRDFPPFDKSLMDGYAVWVADVAQPPVELRVVGEIAAGKWPGRGIGAGETMAIMTGAPMPQGADGVVPVEDVERRVSVGESVRVLRAPAPARLIAPRGSDCPAGKVVLNQGAMMGAPQIAVAASVGAAEVSVYARPRVAVLGTGDELVAVTAAPGAAQIRNSNSPMLVALLRGLGCEVTDLGAVRDEPGVIREMLLRGLEFDALFVTGGMSMGEYDYVPRLVSEMGVTLKITKLKMKPGKPFVFGVKGSGVGVQGSEEKGRGEGRDDCKMRNAKCEMQNEETDVTAAASGSTDPQSEISNLKSEICNPSLPGSPRPPAPATSFIFGLPGNPVAAFVCTMRLAARLLARMGGGEPTERWVIGRLEEGLPANGPREFYQPAVRTVARGKHSMQSEFAVVRPLAWKGSADLFTLAAANVLLVRAAGEPAVGKGAVVRVLEI
ncbi:MAG: molybdenum cofactor synthesis domain protein [Phycisphaerales bacterium]|nr:molybdenum cofactor synthesis domain protein [Phycisphaerales bacterium]